MDRIIKITLGLFIVILAATSAFSGYTMYVMNAYQSSLESSYSYSCSITTDSTLTNVTLFIPVPVDPSGYSPVVPKFSARQINGVPESWQTTLFDTGKTTLVKVYIPSLVPPEGTSPDNPYTVLLTTEVPYETVIDTINPLKNGSVYRPVQNIEAVPCDSRVTAKGGSPVCSTFLTSLYAKYEADPNAAVSIKSSITGRNHWSVMGEKSNEYSSEISLLMHGANHGWANVNGTQQDSQGSYDYPFHIP
ncbi:MAG: hypothetical protein M0Q92_10610 [Methanoregula sp.]|jgi:hypothetical protein|nr:hypothetical protein [Methanoregula sp.]